MINSLFGSSALLLKHMHTHIQTILLFLFLEITSLTLIWTNGSGDGITKGKGSTMLMIWVSDVIPVKKKVKNKTERKQESEKKTHEMGENICKIMYLIKNSCPEYIKNSYSATKTQITQFITGQRARIIYKWSINMKNAQYH